jgi:hypothetical protein
MAEAEIRSIGAGCATHATVELTYIARVFAAAVAALLALASVASLR